MYSNDSLLGTPDLVLWSTLPCWVRVHHQTMIGPCKGAWVLHKGADPRSLVPFATHYCSCSQGPTPWRGLSRPPGLSPHQPPPFLESTSPHLPFFQRVRQGNAPKHTTVAAHPPPLAEFGLGQGMGGMCQNMFQCLPCSLPKARCVISTPGMGQWQWNLPPPPHFWGWNGRGWRELLAYYWDDSSQFGEWFPHLPPVITSPICPPPNITLPPNSGFAD